MSARFIVFKAGDDITRKSQILTKEANEAGDFSAPDGYYISMVSIASFDSIVYVFVRKERKA